MAIKVGDKLPDGTLTEMIETETAGCTIGPNAFQVADLTKGKRIVIFGAAGGVHAHVLGQARARLHGQLRQAQGEEGGRDLVHLGERRVRHGRLGQGSEERGARCA